MCSGAYVNRRDHFGLIWCELIRGLFDGNCLKVLTFKSQQDLRCPKIPFKIQDQSVQRANEIGMDSKETGSDIGCMKFEAVYMKSHLPLKYCPRLWRNGKHLNSLSNSWVCELDKQCSLAFYSSLKQSDFDLYTWSRQHSKIFFPLNQWANTYVLEKLIFICCSYGNYLVCYRPHSWPSFYFAITCLILHILCGRLLIKRNNLQFFPPPLPPSFNFKIKASWYVYLITQNS